MRDNTRVITASSVPGMRGMMVFRDGDGIQTTGAGMEDFKRLFPEHHRYLMRGENVEILVHVPVPTLPEPEVA